MQQKSDVVRPRSLRNHGCASNIIGGQAEDSGGVIERKCEPHDGHAESARGLRRGRLRAVGNDERRGTHPGEEKTA